jgi:hypothetical protein
MYAQVTQEQEQEQEHETGGVARQRKTQTASQTQKMTDKTTPVTTVVLPNDTIASGQGVSVRLVTNVLGVI